ncbi:hypothetical protein A2962_03775 [Candidatus Woesebacteria bacterium RIFCSPLOWO2_01_FULL_39_61]|uniref:Uncharacterized protein n=1 Tax=Candidatus Woesebacteria bacterium RIFCSPHIGHO2_02_FULL_39_13 TaxID=1802505 RepID=A0A1F7Z2Z6_9BACT|nr:MAG: hypothetical protein A2692_03955 [Candidatus Woesebacteria bacterium RIFCSPHIGHO2_01_FULL_39_95]OGM33810.1 MAG: hypothetical protein A3D01_02465 [Candidatus Woesebacteria bacterium RIFCSPHIGHO2_02_FULL_39_13]OGM38971.1 MAG: hypothetical protein A3E13_04735 [Candidatus Woesebacteria bacterium RIFCSPHIGHO2_12_FULL_40_20]OGM65619.1 MAG: hypothetical protein A2962_03775 [Candidatus Woesebacteria bacterium RIFCSPLOWO2_01_FULL_39_61]OGM72807.1 MAG: hypothetical protein A3H19_05600 [Candidatus
MYLFRVRKSVTKFLSLLLTLSLISAQTVRAVDIVISENGAGSTSQATVESTSTTSVQQSNTSTIDNSLDVSSNTGDNSTSDNTGGSTQISTGDATTSVDVDNTTNISQVNSDNCCTGENTLAISGNGSGSENIVSLNQKSTVITSINQSANITNNIQGDANTGANLANNNTGDVTIKTGGIKVAGSIVNDPINIASVSVAGGNGDIEALIKRSGAESQNFIYASFINNNNVLLNQEANILNNVNWNLVTGDNSANDNTGDVTIKTGDISLDFFIRNFVNLGSINITDCCQEEIFEDGEEEPKIEPPTEDGEDGGNGGDGGVHGGGSSREGVLLSEAASTGPGVIGLSDTSSEVAQALFFWIGLGMVILGLKYITCEIPSKKLTKRRLYL